MARPHIRDLFRFDLVGFEVGSVTLGLDHRPELGHAPGWFQGTVTTAIAECAAAMSGATTAPDKDSLTLQQTIHFVGAARGDRLIAEGRVIARGRTISTTAADVYVMRDGARHLCGTLTMTMNHRALQE
nr:PaaI family thioesterase [Novosphingobium taihuense]